MKPEDFEQHLRRQPWRTIPPAWRAEVLAAARPTPSPAPPARWGFREQLQYWLWPNPRAWAAAAAIWAVSLTGNVWINTQPFDTAAQPVAENQLLDHLRHRQRVIAELLDAGESQEPPVPGRSIPRGEWRGGNRMG